MTEPIPRHPWPPGFPDVVIHTTVAERDAHPDYAAAKAGDSDAANRLVESLLSAAALDTLRSSLGRRRPVVVPVAAIETTGFNAIPDALAQALADAMALEAERFSVVQVNRVAHTRATAAHRLMTPPRFEGEITAGADYLIVDDHVGLGGTIANLRGYIESNGGRVIIASTLTESRDSRKLALHPETLRRLREKHGEGLEQFWRDSFGYGLDCLTEPEAGYLLRGPSLDGIRDRLAAAAAAAGGRGVPEAEIPALVPSRHLGSGSGGKESGPRPRKKPC